MSKVITDSANYTAIANAIRAKNGSQTTYKPSEMAAAIAAIASGGATNLVTGTFKGTTTGAAMDVPLNYTGSGYPILTVIYPKGGVIGNSSFTSTVQRYALCEYSIFKRYTSSDYAATYNGNTNSNANSGYVTYLYKSSASNAANISAQSSQSLMIYNNTTAAAGINSCVKIKAKNMLSVYIASAGEYGFMANIDYDYMVLYSS